MEAYKVRAVLEGLLEADKPAEAMCALAMQADDEGAEAFRRYAGDVFRAAGALSLAESGLSAIHLRRCADESLVRLCTVSDPFAQEPAMLQVLEDSLNRLLGIGAALECGVGSQMAASPESPSSRRREKYAALGAAYPLWSDPTRGAHVNLPPLSPHEQPTCAYFREVDWRMLDCVASIAHLCYQSTILANSNQVIFGVKAPHCSEWDVRTRLASSLHNLWPSLRLTYRYDCDLSRNTVAVHFNLPPLESFPAPDPGPASSTTALSGKRLENARMVYALRLSALIASACFGAGRSVDHTFVVGLDASGEAVLSCSFTRDQFVHETLPAIDAGRLSTPELRYDPDRVREALSARAAEYTLARKGVLPRGGLANVRIAPYDDVRVLPEDMQRFFHALRVCDLDVSLYHGGSADAIDEARADSRESAVAAIARLEGVVEELESELEPPEALPQARPLHCENALQRAAIALLDDELSIGADAEAFLSFEEADEVGKLPDVFYYRAPSALYHAHVGLADLFRMLGDERGAEAHADRCIALGPTMPAGYALKAGVLARRGNSRQAANVVISGLRTAIADNDRALLLHELAFLFKRMGRLPEADALLTCCATMKGIYAQRALEVIGKAREGADARAFVRANSAQALAVVGKMGIRLVTDRMRTAIVARAALGLANAHAPRAAAPYVELLQEQFPDEPAIMIACNSIRFGLA